MLKKRSSNFCSLLSLSSKPAFLHLDGISCFYGEQRIVNDCGFSLAAGEIGCLLGPSGCGKTTILHCIAGFNQIASGSISLNQQRLSDVNNTVKPEQRHMGLVYQEHALFPHMTVLQNICFGLFEHSKQQQNLIAQELLNLVQLEQHAHDYPHQLSGGEQQRVALARSLAVEPQLMLLDEPFSSLDKDLREELSASVYDILKEKGITALLVTHDQSEAFAMADKVGVMQQGKIMQWGTPSELYKKPSSMFVADFMGSGNMIEAKVVSQNTLESGFGAINGTLTGAFSVNDRVKLLVRPENVIVTKQYSEQTPIAVTVVSKRYQGAQSQCVLSSSNDHHIQALIAPDIQLDVGATCFIGLSFDHISCFIEH